MSCKIFGLMNCLRGFILMLGLTGILGGCSTDSSSTAPEAHVQLGMSRDDLKFYFGNPVRIEPVAGGGENWIYRFSAWKTEQQNSSDTTYDFDGKTTTSSVSWQFGTETEEKPVHISAEGFVVKPLPGGKLVK